ncbi:MAG: LysM peptidoglycan-binding domain-containing protein [Hyphomicrobium sp.]
MMSIERSYNGGKKFNRAVQVVTVAAIAAVASGCSADITRFDYPPFNLTGDTPKSTASVQRPREPVNRAPSYADNGGRSVASGSYNRGGYGAPPRYGDGAVETARLSPPVNTVRSYGNNRRYNRQPPARQAAPTLRRGRSIEVQQGDTLYGLSRRHNVSVAELMEINGLSNPNLRPGQELYLPAGSEGRSPPLRETRTARGPASLSPSLEAKYSGSHTVAPGESLYGISRRHGVSVAELQQINGIDNPRTVRVGTVLKVPASVATASYQNPTRSRIIQPPRYSQSQQPTVINQRRTRVAALNTGTATDAAPVSRSVRTQRLALAAPSAASAGSKLRWPVEGRIVTGFGRRNDGTHNDGVNISVPLGTQVHAAESGVVAYAGSELKGYGNLVLLRHDNGWVTAYAHNEQLTVKRGDKVQRGQVIARAGRTGSVDQPQLHFELRQGSKPVDPVPFLERL